MPDADELRREMKEKKHNELKEQNREQKEQHLQLTQLIQDLASNKKKSHLKRPHKGWDPLKKDMTT